MEKHFVHKGQLNKGLFESGRILSSIGIPDCLWFDISQAANFHSDFRG